MSRWRRFGSRLPLGMHAMLAMLCACWLGASPAFAVRYGAIEVTVEPRAAVEGTQQEMRPGGYIEHRVTVRNHSKTADHTVRLVHPDRRGTHYLDYLGRNARTVRVAHGSSLVVPLFQPALPVTNDSLAVEIDGNRQEDLLEMPSDFAMWYGYRSGPLPSLAVLTSRGIPQELKDQVRTAHPDIITFHRSELAAGDWSSNWLGYTAYDLLLLTEQEAASLPAEVLLALRRYVEAGGILLVQESTPDSTPMIPDELHDPASEPDDEGAFRVGFGLVRPCPPSAPWPSEFWTARSKEAVIPQDPDVQIIHEISVPIGGLLLVVILFAIVIGPVNVGLLSRYRKRMWLWWNVPAVSLATCLAVFIYSLISEGITARGRTALITLLDENTHRATTLGYVSYYCPLTPSDGLHFSYDTAVAQLHANEISSMRFDSGRPKTIDWTNDQHLDTGWAMSRVPACFSVCKNETRRERLTVHRDADGAVKVVNGLGVTIESLVYRDENGVFSTADDVPPGAEQVLKQSKPKVRPPGKPQFLRTLFDQPWNTSLRELQSVPERYVGRGCYVAVVKKTPFLEDPLVTASQEGSTGVIYGIGARAGNGR